MQILLGRKEATIVPAGAEVTAPQGPWHGDGGREGKGRGSGAWRPGCALDPQLDRRREPPFDATEYAKASASDMWITTAVKTRLLADEQTPGFEINVDASNGRVTLFGSVDSDQMKRRAEAEARKVAGVQDVENMLQVVAPVAQPAVARADADLASEVGKRISEREELATNDVSVQVEDAVVRLTGTIDGSGDRLAALTAARGVVGVTKVIDDLRVEPPAVGAR